MSDSPADASGSADTSDSDADERGISATEADSKSGPTGEPDADEASPSYSSTGSGMRARDVEVPMRVYKTVTVFSTLIAVVCVVGGFVLLDRATGRAQLPISKVDPILALAGIATILFGAATYAFATRFRAAGMGSSKNDDDEPADNG